MSDSAISAVKGSGLAQASAARPRIRSPAAFWYRVPMQTSNAIRFPVLISTRSLPVNIIAVIAASLLIALAAQVAFPIPFSPVPLTLQPLAVLLVGAVLGPVRGAAAATLYLLEGLAGMPVFAGGRAGLPVLLGPTAGYLYAFPAAAFIAGYANRNILRTAALMVAGIVVIHLG